MNQENQSMTEQTNSPQTRNMPALNQSVGLSKNQLDAIAVLAFRFYEQGKAENAKTMFEGLIALDPNLYYGYAGLGAIALRDEKLDDAVTYLSRAVDLKPEDPTVYANLGEALLRQAKFSEAAGEFDRALKLDPQQRDPGANRARAILYGMNSVVSEMKRVSAA
jgi:tetratricopeptide (TPR) repeat protein